MKIKACKHEQDKVNSTKSSQSAHPSLQKNRINGQNSQDEEAKYQAGDLQPADIVRHGRATLRPGVEEEAAIDATVAAR